jgi:hypothetical protein
MAKELPYFRFTPQEWQNGNISLERYELKGLFADIMSYYWIKDCSITLAMLKKRFVNDHFLLNELIENKIIRYDKKTDYVTICFLDEQFDVLSEARKRRQEAGAKGGKQKYSNAKAMLKQSSSYKDKDKDKEKDKEKDKINSSEHKRILIAENRYFGFKEFWELYSKNVNQQSTEQEWNQLTAEEIQQVFDTCYVYIEGCPDIRYRVNPDRWLREKMFKSDYKHTLDPKIYNQQTGKRHPTQ